MVAIRAYTTIEQSRKLAEILPLESADMYWKNGVSDKYIQCFTPFVVDDDGSNVDFDYDIPCWSLAALLGVLPEYNLQRTDWGNKTEYKIVVTVNENNYASKNYDNPLDACVDMILKLNELNLF